MKVCTCLNCANYIKRDFLVVFLWNETKYSRYKCFIWCFMFCTFHIIFILDPCWCTPIHTCNIGFSGVIVEGMVSIVACDRCVLYGVDVFLDVLWGALSAHPPRCGVPLRRTSTSPALRHRLGSTSSCRHSVRPPQVFSTPRNNTVGKILHCVLHRWRWIDTSPVVMISWQCTSLFK